MPVMPLSGLPLLQRLTTCLVMMVFVWYVSTQSDAFAASNAKPNILLIYADDIGYEALNCYGGLDFETPRLNAMAAAGMRFSRAYASPVCTPSRVSMHTSLYTTRHGHIGVLPVHLGTDRKVDFLKMPTYAQLMRANGYATSVTGKWQLATLEAWPDHIRDSGFDSWCIWQIWREGKKTRRHWNPTFNEDGKVRDDIADRFGPDVLAEYVIEQMTEAKEAGKPFLIVHNELLPHDPIIQTPDDRKLGRKAQLGGMINYMDKLVGRLLDEVETLGIRDNTYVVFMGDNGTHDVDFKNPKVGQPNELKHTRHTAAGNVNGGKAHLGDAGTHVPLLVWGPDSVPQGQVCDELVDIVDLFPTFCELSGTTIPASLSIDGRSIAPQIHGRPGTPRAWVHHAFGRNKGSGENIFDGSWRLFRDSGQLWDARALPTESPAAEDDAEARAARDRLNTILEKITHDGRRPPEEFPVLEDDRLPVFQQLLREDWKEVFFDPCTEDWRERWTLDGLKATVTNSKRGMDFKAGPVRKEDASHAVMWTKDSFQGDIRLDYEYTKLDDAVEAVTILYLQATGSGADGYDKDISKWRDKRDVAYMKTYFNHMHLHHISYAAFDVGNKDPLKDYIRARRYMPESKNGLANTNFEPDYLETGLFAKGVPHQITVIKKDDNLFMHVSNNEKALLCHWKTNSFPPILGGRVGLRHMWTRGARYRNFRVWQLKEREESRE